MATREEIIADWRTRLTSAEEPLNPDSQRTAWLSRLRLRLYRFLLSLYGDGRWNAPDSPKKSPDAEPVVLSERALPLAGKPAKDEQQIRAVLKSVAGASNSSVKPGPLASGVARPDPAISPVVGERPRPAARGGQLIRNICLAAMTASICVLFSVGLIYRTDPIESPRVQTFAGQIVILALACFITSAIVFGVFANPKDR